MAKQSFKTAVGAFVIGGLALLVAGIVRRNGQTVIPSGNDALQEGDDVVIVTTDTTLHSLRDIVK